ncbi:MAG TPA: glycosyltransferase [Allosphingosinicella sp.]
MTHSGGPPQREGTVTVLHVITGLNAGGAELMLRRLVETHAGDSRYRHRVVSLREWGPVGDQLREAGVEVEALGITGAASFARGFLRLVGIVRRVRPDIVQTWMYHADLVGGAAARLAGVKAVIWGVRVADIFPAMGVSRSLLWGRRLSARLSRLIPARILYVAESARQVHERLGYSADRSIVIQNGYRIPSDAEVAEARARRRAELGIGADVVLIGTAGRFSPQKGFDGFVKGAAALAARHPDVRFVMLGREVDPGNPAIAGWIGASGHADRFHALGETRVLHEWLSAMDVFGLYSLGEGFPNVVAEAMSVGTPCVVTDVGDAALLVDTTGRVVAAGDLDGFTAALEALVAAGPEGRRRLGAAARARVETHFSMAAIAKRYGDLYEELTSAGAPAGAGSE